MKEELLIGLTFALFGGTCSLTVRITRAQWLLWRFLWKTRAAARRIRDAGFTRTAIVAEERKLFVAFYEARGLIDPYLVNHALIYLQLTRDIGKKPWRWLRVVLLTVMSIDAFMLASMVADAVVADGSLLVRLLLAVLVGAVGGLLAGFFTHAAGERLSRNEAAANIRRWAMRAGVPLVDVIVSFNQRQNIDAHLQPNERAWNRCLRGGSLWPLHAAIASVAALGVTAFFMRLTQFANLRAQNIPDLPSSQEVLLSLSAILIIFIALQGSMVWLAYTTALFGRESTHALKVTGNGRFHTVVEVERYLGTLCNSGKRIQLRLHEHITRWNVRCGDSQVTGPILDPVRVLYECIRQGRGTGEYIGRDDHQDDEE